MRSVQITIAVFFLTALLSGCASGEEARREVLETVGTLRGSASGVLSTARDHIDAAIDVGRVAKEEAEALVEDVSNRAGKVKEGVGLVREGLSGEQVHNNE